MNGMAYCHCDNSQQRKLTIVVDNEQEQCDDNKINLTELITSIVKEEPVVPGSVLVNLTNSIDPEILQRLAECSMMPRTLASLAFNPSVEVRQAVADNVHTPLSALLMLAHDENPDVRFQLAENHNIPEAVLQVLCEDDNPYVRWRATTTLNRMQ